MASQVLEQNRAYRRGLIVGLTMAEITVLIIFCLLLASSFALEENEARTRNLQSENLELRKVESTLAELKKHAVDPAKFDELFKELKRQQVEVETLTEERSRLRKVIDAFKDLEPLREALQLEISRGSSTSDAIQTIRKDADYGKQLRDHAERKGIKPLSPEAVVATISGAGEAAGLYERTVTAEVEANRMKGQLANVQQKLEKLGKGTEMPACWADPATGKPEYIFRVELKSTGLTIHDQKLSNRTAEQATLPISMITFAEELERSTFRSQTSPLAQWSIAHGCRFFVTVRDLTGPAEKDSYKAMLRTVEEHFYKFEDR